MILRLIGIALVVSFLNCSRGSHPVPEKPAKFPDTLTVLSYNVENLFGFQDNGSEYPEFKPGQCNWTSEIQRRKVENIASVIAATDAQIVALCEVEDTEVLAQLSRELRYKGKPYPFYCIGTSPQRSAIYPALISKIRFSSYSSISTGNGRGERPILEVHFNADGRDLIVFVNHWPSLFHPESARIVPAQLLESRLKQIAPGTDYIVAGDFNSDYDQCVTLHTRGFDDTHGIAAINQVLGTVRSAPGQEVRYTRKADMTGSTGGLYDTWMDLPEQQRFSFMYRGTMETPDHILLPSSLFDSTGYSYLDNSFSRFTWEGKLLKDGVPYQWQMRYGSHGKYHLGEGYSDHLPVYARFVKGPFHPAQRLGAADTTGSQEAAGPEGTGSFEESCEGWVNGDAKATLTRDTTYHSQGRYSLKILENPQAKNSTAARVVFPVDTPVTSITFDMRGSGKLSLRLRTPGKRWTYFNGQPLTRSGSARYGECRCDSWRHVVLPVTAMRGDIELEVRAGKNSTFRFWIDNVRMGRRL